MDESRIIAEIGQNHCGDMDLAEVLIDETVNCGADLVKFQLYDHNMLYSNHPEIPNAGLSFEQAMMLFEYGYSLGMEVFFSVFDAERVKWCEEIGVKRYKIACNMRDSDTLEAIEKTGKPIILSSKVRTVSSLNIEANLYCVPKYPAEIEDIDWMQMIACNGFSDHTIGLEACKRAIDSGIRVIEKHFAIDHKTGVDAPWSMTPNELRELVEYSSNNTSKARVTTSAT